MRILILFFAFLLSFHMANAIGNIKLGLMVGVNSALNNFDQNNAVKSIDSKLGYNGNAFGRLIFGNFVVQPELGYLYNRAGMTVTESGKSVDLNLELGQMYSAGLLGMKIGNLRLLAGPMATLLATQSSQKISAINSDIQQFTSGSNNLSWGGMVDVGVDISKKLSIDARYSRTFSNNEFKAIVDGNTSTFSGNTGMLSLNLGFSIFSLK